MATTSDGRGGGISPDWAEFWLMRADPRITASAALAMATNATTPTITHRFPMNLRTTCSFLDDIASSSIVWRQT
ncbi:MAG TPA: hypothetical protein VF148_04660 [Acidimicrobiia bacterium]